MDAERFSSYSFDETIGQLTEDVLAEIISYFPLTQVHPDLRLVSHFFDAACKNLKKLIIAKLRHSCVVLVHAPLHLDDQLGFAGEGITEDSDGTLSVPVVVFRSGIAARFILQPLDLNPFVTFAQVQQLHAMVKSFSSKMNKVEDSCFSFVMHNLTIAAGLTTEQLSDESMKDITTGVMPSDPSAWRGAIFNHFQDKISTIFTAANIGKHYGSGTKWNIHSDNPNSRVLSDFIRYTKSWEGEKIGLSMFYYAKDDLGGMVLAKYCAEEELLFSNLYVAKKCSYRYQNIDIPSTETMVLASLVPVADYLVCSYIKKLEGFDHVEGMDIISRFYIRETIKNGDVITCGASAKRGSWNNEPPPLD